MHTSPSFVSHGEAAISMQPSQGPLHHPARPAQAAAVRRAALGQQRANPPTTEFVPVPLGIVAPIALHDPRPAPRRARTPAEGRNRVDQRQQLRDVMPVRRCQDRDERDAARVCDHVVLATGLAAIGGVRSSFFPPRNARREALSTIARATSSWPRRRNSASNTICRRFQTPARCQRTSRRQQVVPDPQPISCGSMFHGSPLRSTNRMPVKTARSGIGARPAYRRLRGFRFGNNGSIRVHRSSSMENVAMRDRLRLGHATVPNLDQKYKF